MVLVIFLVVVVSREFPTLCTGTLHAQTAVFDYGKIKPKLRWVRKNYIISYSYVYIEVYFFPGRISPPVSPQKANEHVPNATGKRFFISPHFSILGIERASTFSCVSQIN